MGWGQFPEWGSEEVAPLRVGLQLDRHCPTSGWPAGWRRLPTFAVCDLPKGPLSRITGPGSRSVMMQALPVAARNRRLQTTKSAPASLRGWGKTVRGDCRRGGQVGVSVGGIVRGLRASAGVDEPVYDGKRRSSAGKRGFEEEPQSPNSRDSALHALADSLSLFCLAWQLRSFSSFCQSVVFPARIRRVRRC